jgi:parallel beta-helix repeat protein
VHDVQFFGGEIVGRNDRWPDGINVGGIRLTGACRRIRIRDMHIRDLSSNGIGIFASAEQPTRDVWVTDTIIQNCCNKYGDYTAPAGELRGPEKGSTRQDQGLVAFYFVNEFLVRGCRFEDSRSDGTHFFRCRAGQFVDNKVYRAKMGGYFLESCEHVLAANNVIIENGSRGVTIERGSVRCMLQGNTVEGSGREGLWLPDCRQCVVTGNLFIRNGRKPNTPRQIWNSNITINEAAPSDPSNQWTPGTQDYLIAHNTVETDASQVAAIRVVSTPRLRQITIKDNLLLGANRRIVVEGEQHGEVRLAGNDHEP